MSDLGLSAKRLIYPIFARHFFVCFVQTNWIMTPPFALGAEFELFVSENSGHQSTTTTTAVVISRDSQGILRPTQKIVTDHADYLG